MRKFSKEKYDDAFFMGKALSLAKKATGRTSPNPLVGAIIVHKGEIISEGFHVKAGKAHAEINALKKLKKIPKGSKMYVTLEPMENRSQR